MRIIRFEFLKAYLADPQSLSGMHVETMYHERAKTKLETVYEEVSLQDLRKRYTTEVEVRFLEEQIIAKQEGVAHPQAPWLRYMRHSARTDLVGPSCSEHVCKDPDNKDMRLYKVFRNKQDTSSDLGTSIVACHVLVLLVCWGLGSS